ncbi:MAG: hypothetical protein Aurels2KO_07880 [Aureliella sp.]
MKMTRSVALMAATALPTCGWAQDADDKIEPPKVMEIDRNGQGEDAEIKADIVLQGLNNPCGVAIQPETGDVFVADSGNYQIIKMGVGESDPVITDFPKDVYGKGPKVNIGPLGLLFLSKDALVVGGGGQPDGAELLRVYKVPADGESIKAEETEATFSLAETDDVKGEGNFYALASDGEAVYVTCNGDDTKGWVSRAAIKDGTLVDFERYLATKEATEVDAPVGITMSPQDQGGYMVVGQMGEISIPGDSLLSFYDEEKNLRLNLETGLHDICAVAYSSRKRLYVLDYAWADTTQGGLFQVVADEESDSGMKTVKIMSLDKPTAMAFAPDGSLYITALGPAEDANSKGILIKIPAEAKL